MPFFGGGEAEAAQAAKDEKASRKNRYRGPQERYLKDGDDFLVRFLTDRTGPHPWIPSESHLFIPTKPKPDEVTFEWPAKWSAICRNSRIFGLRDSDGKRVPGFEDGYGDCYIDNNYVGQTNQFGQDLSKPEVLTYGLAVICEKEYDPASPSKSNPAVIGFKDKTEEYRPFGAKTSVQVPHIVVFAQKYDRFWASVSAACYDASQTVCDKIYRVQKIGKEIKVTMLNITENHRPGLPSWQKYPDALKVMNDFSLEGYLLERSSKDYYDRWFVPGATPKDGYSFGGAKDEAETETASAGTTSPSQPAVDPDRVNSFRDRLQNRGTQQQAS